MTRLLSRKFIVTVLSLLSATALCALGHIHEGVYSTVMAANVTQKATAKEAAP